MQSFRQQWFLICLFLLIPGGMWAGQSPAVLSAVNRGINTQLVVFLVLFLMSFTLQLAQLKKTAARPGGVLLAVVINSLLLPLLAWGMVALDADSPFAIGLLLVGAVPSTLASAAVWTRRAGGNDAIPLVGTLITNGSCFLVIPFWLWITLGQSIPLNTGQLMWQLLITALLPMMLGQWLRTIPLLQQLADARKPVFSLLAQMGVLTIVAVGSVRTGPILATSAADLSLAMLALLLGQCLLIHGVGLMAGWYGGLWISGARSEALGVMFSGSQKTLPIAIELATSPVLLAAGMSPLAILPPLVFHASQLLLDTVIMEKLKLPPVQNPAAGDKTEKTA